MLETKRLSSLAHVPIRTVWLYIGTWVMARHNIVQMRFKDDILLLLLWVYISAILVIIDIGRKALSNPPLSEQMCMIECGARM